MDVPILLVKLRPEGVRPDRVYLRHWLVLTNGIPKIPEVVHGHTGCQNQDVLFSQSRNSFSEAVVLVWIFVFEE